MSGRRGERAPAREGADVQLVDALPFERSAPPVRVSPAERPRVYAARSPVRPFGLKPRGRVWIKVIVAVEAEAVERARPHTFGEAGEVAALPLFEREGFRRALAFEDDFHSAPA